MPNSISVNLTNNSGGLIAEEIKTNLIPKDGTTPIGLLATDAGDVEEIQSSELFQKKYDEGIESAFAKISKMSVGNECPPIGIFREAVGQELLNSVVYFEAFKKKFLKEYPKKKQKFVGTALTVHVLAEIVYNGFRVGFEWGKNGKPEVKEINVEVKKEEEVK